MSGFQAASALNTVSCRISLCPLCTRCSWTLRWSDPVVVVCATVSAPDVNRSLTTRRSDTDHIGDRWKRYLSSITRVDECARVAPDMCAITARQELP